MNIRIIIVEDERIIAEDIRMTVENLGFEVVGLVNSGKEVLKLLNQEQVDLVMMDIHIQGEMDGIEAAKMIYNQYNTPVVFLTAYADPTTVERIRQTTAYGFIVKPISQDSIQGILELAIDRHRMDCQLKEREDKLAHVNRVLRGIRNVNQLIVKETDTSQLIQGVCDNLIEDLGYHAVWIVLMNKKRGELLYRQAGFENKSHSFHQQLKKFKMPDCTMKNKKKEDVLLVQCPGEECKGCPLSEEFPGFSRFTQSFQLNSGETGAMSVVVPQSYAVDKDEQDLFNELTDDVIFALNKLYLEKVHQEAERQKDESSLMLKTIINAIPVRVFWKDKKLRYLGCNMKFAQDAGLESPEEIVGKTDKQLPWHDQAAKYQKSDREIIKTECAKIRFEEPQMARDGKVRILRKSKIPLRNIRGEVIGILGTYENVTPQKNAENDLKMSQEKYQALLNGQDDAVFLHPLLEKGFAPFEEVNEVACKRYGYTHDEFKKLTARDITLDADVAVHARNEVRSQLLSKGHMIFQTSHFTKSGHFFPVEINSTILELHGKKYILAVVRDISKRKNIEKS